MKTTVKFTVMLLMFMLAFNISMNAQPGMKGTMDYGHMNRMSGDTTLHHGMRMRGDTLRMRGMRHEMAPWRYYPQGQFFDHRQMYGMHRGMEDRPGMRGYMVPGQDFRGAGTFDRRGQGAAGPGRQILESVPNVTEKQKKEITELLQKQREDVIKVRQEMTAKIKTIRENSKKSLNNILTDEQKKYLDSRQGNTNTKSRKKIIDLPEKALTS